MTLKFPAATVHIMNRLSSAERESKLAQAAKGGPVEVSGLRIKAATGDSPSGLEMNGSVTSAVGKEGEATTLTLEVFNLDDDLAMGTAPEGFIKVQAGYRDADDKDFEITPSADTIIFFGVITDRFPVRSDDSNSWKFTASTLPSLLQAHTVLNIGPTEQGNQGPTIGQVIQDLLNRAGASLNPSATSLGLNPNVPRRAVEVRELHASGPIIELARELTKDIGDQVSRAKGRKGVHDHLLVPMPNEPMTFELVDTGTPEQTAGEGSQLVGRPVADVNLDKMTVHRAAPSLEQGEFDVTYPPSLMPDKPGRGGSEKAEQQQEEVDTRSRTYDFVGALDPRMNIGTPAKVIDTRLSSGSGFAIVTDVKHRFGNEWRTSWSGPFGLLPQGGFA